MSCKFISELRRLSKLSAEAVQNIESFDPLKTYLHVTRQPEEDFRNLMLRISGINHKQLILVCGSAGDGKSHLLSYLKFADSQHILNGYALINDATESNAPTATAIETLAERIAAFRDDRIDDGGCEKVVLAINLGMLNNFIDSPYGNNFTRLRNYVINNRIFSVEDPMPFDKNGVFQHIDFSDYQLYSLTADGPKSNYLTELLGKIFANTPNNPFYSAYTSSSSCPHHSHCPVRHNFEFLMSKTVQAMLVQRIIEICVKEKLIVTSRDVLNFVFDAIASPDFDDKKFWQTISNPTKFLEAYISYTTPMLMFENSGTSDLLDLMSANNTHSGSIEDRDTDLLSFYAADDITATVSNVLGHTKYAEMVLSCNLQAIDNSRDDLKKYVFKFLMHFQNLANPESLMVDKTYIEFVADLYNSRAGHRMKLRELYSTVKNSIYTWDGAYGNDLICIDDTNDDYCILEQLIIESDVIPGTGEAEVFRFTPSISVRFSNEAGSNNVRFSIDYSLYKLIKAMREGYCPTSQDRNIHADFVSSIRELAEFGSKKTRVMIVPKRKTASRKYMFKAGGFGYSFKEV